ncbi:hypothetical protein FE257_010244 [Aspergillus nanangensis]|uniref:Amidase domain-containing protein n=1 Tax=Aspergillus nanangensis TaxID=2582783 RepID=A0AAD4CIX0_ASPNN|nr:hypothetical protein FE257_010244 [Aspergillus nanangensis]
MSSSSILHFHSALVARQTTATATISSYLGQITQHNPTLNALLTINHDALIEAQEKDTQLTYYINTQTPLPPLFAVPLILKDTYTTAPPLPTTSGIRALRSLQSHTDAPVVARLKSAGAIVLAKANLHEFSLEGVTVSSLGGQTRNPYDLTRTPGGSSGGTAAALAAGMGLVGCGGDTMNSLRSPASACAVIVNDTINAALEKVKSAAANEVEFVDLPHADWDVAMLRDTADTQAYEFKEQFDTFLGDKTIFHDPVCRTLAEIVESGEYHHDAVTDVLRLTLRPEEGYSTTSLAYRERLRRIETLKEEVEKCFREYRLDAMVYPHQRQLVVEVGEMRQPGRNGLLASLTGRPAICIPGGFSPPSETAPIGIPIGLELMGKPDDDEKLLDLAERFEESIQARKIPVGY